MKAFIYSGVIALGMAFVGYFSAEKISSSKQLIEVKGLSEKIVRVVEPVPSVLSWEQRVITYLYFPIDAFDMNLAQVPCTQNSNFQHNKKISAKIVFLSIRLP